jgi:hypothetical protein
MPPQTSKYLRIYLNDHLMGSTTGVELAKRIAGQNAGTPLGDFMKGLTRDIAEDRQELKLVMAQLGVPVNPAKVAAGWVAERAARLTLNGEIRGYSPLSRLVEIESLSLGIEGKRLLWIALTETEADRLGAERLARLTARAEAQRAGVEEHRRAAARGMGAAPEPVTSIP